MRIEPRDTESLDHLVGGWRIFQLRRGHRFSTDDLVTAWRARHARPNAVRYLDMGCGIGSVGLSTLHHLPPSATMVGVEAQEVSVGLARRTVAYNNLADRVSIVHGDLRDPAVLPEAARFDLVTGSPPYIPEGKGVLSPVPQRAHARMELRGSIFDYCAAARRWMAPGARFCFVMAAADPRTEEAPLAADLVVLERWDYVFRQGRAPHIATLVCARREDIDVPVPRRTGTLVVRDTTGTWTDEYLAFRRDVSNQPC
ncbi:MAG: tRNA1Val (adenine37-N6)-methyltransferase [Myxococcota bacterium]|jgi:tRNA1Val (adenine37-N6)-methyltransferase